MKLNLVCGLSQRAMAYVFLLMLAILAPVVSATEVEDYVAKLKSHYRDTLSIQAYSLNQHFTNKQYRSLNYWDYQTPNVYMSVRSTEVDLARKHFYDNDILYFAGGRLYDRVKFQNDAESFFYERSATVYGRAVIREGMDNFDRSVRYLVMNVDFLAVRPLLEEGNVADNISLSRDEISATTILTHRVGEDQSVEYKFSDNPKQLVSINHGPMNGLFVYEDYQTTRGITYARSLKSYYDGAAEPQYIKFNSHFEVLDEVDPAKLKLPEGYGPELQRGDGIYVAKEIADNLYLATDSSDVINTILKVVGSEITVFGGSNNTRVAEKIVGLVKEQFSGKKIASVYVTHPHADQVAGLKTYVEQGAEVVADAYTIEAIKAYAPFAEDISKFRFKAIEHEQTIAGVSFYVLENIHSKRQSFAYFKESGIIFQAHFLHVPRDNTIAKVIPSYTKNFIDFVRAKDLKISRIVSNHRNNDISVDVMNRTYDAQSRIK